MKVLSIFFGAGFFLSTALGSETTKFAGKPEMNQIRFKDYAGFEKEWNLITVRYRTDTTEQRFTYANAKAFQALRDNSKDYPDGAIFGKIGFETEDDPVFASSKVPSGAKRIQLMVRDKKKYASTGGWGYALFDRQGLTFEEDPHVKTMACYACHQIVKDRGQVFSQLMDIGTSGETVQASREALAERLKFVDVKTSELPPRLKAFLRPNVTAVRSLTGPLRKHLFQGTLDEIRPALLKETIKAKRPALLLSEDGTRFSMMAAEEHLLSEDKSDCPGSQKSYRVISSGPFDGKDRMILEAAFCDGR